MIRLNLRKRVLLILSGFVLLILLLGLVLVWYTLRIEGLLTAITGQHLRAFRAADALEAALMHQKGLAAYHLLDGDPDWLAQQERLEQEAREQLARIREAAGADAEDPRQTLEEIASEFAAYTEKKKRVLAFYRAGDAAGGAALHREVHGHFDALIDRSAGFKSLHTGRILEAEAAVNAQVSRLRLIALAAVLGFSGLILLLAFIFVYQIIYPLQRLTMEAYRSERPTPSENEVAALRRGVRVLLHNVDHTQSELERSRESLLQAEKMALVGQLAAGMAHSLRNPFTSVKMRLFSLGRSLELNEAQREDFEVIAAEIRHIDAIVQNFLEFSRPPTLRLQPIAPSSVVDAALRLLEHRLKAYGVTVTLDRTGALPQVRGDPEQLKEVLVNLMVNACEAMATGGRIEIEERWQPEGPLGPAAVIRVRDSGPGIPAPLLEKIFQPFFTTKEQGTGLGLSIAQRIIREHGGRIEAASVEGQGAAFTLTLPAREARDEHDPDH